MTSPLLLLLSDHGRVDIARDFNDDGYNTERYRTVYDNPDSRTHPPSFDIPPTTAKKNVGAPRES